MQSRSFSRVLISFFTIFLIVYSVYMLSFTWFVRGHEKKLEAKAKQYMARFPLPAQKFPGDSIMQKAWQDSLDAFYQRRLRELKDSTSDVTLTYGPTGAINYKTAKENELNLGLDLQGGQNVTLEVELSGLIRALANNSKDLSFNKAITNAEARKANSGADFVTLFVEEFQNLAGKGKLAGLFALNSHEKINPGDSDDKVRSYIKEQAKTAFDNTFRVLSARIDQFGVAQPNINPDPDRAIINVELPGIQDEARVNKYLQSSANLQFWELYSPADLIRNGSLDKMVKTFSVLTTGTDVQDTAKKIADTSAKANDTTAKIKDTATKSVAKIDSSNLNSRSQIFQWIQFNIDQKGAALDAPNIGYVKFSDTLRLRTYLESEAILNVVPPDLIWMFGIPENKEEFKKTNAVPLYAVRTFGRPKAELEGDVITEAHQDYAQSGLIEVSMTMNNKGARTWADMTGRNAPNKTTGAPGKFIAIALDNIIQSAPRVNDRIEGGRSSISGGFETEQEAKDLANILKAGRLPAPAKIVQKQTVGPTLGKDAIAGGLKAFTISFIVIFLLMLIYYNTSGWIANIALILNLLFTIGVLTGLGATLTAPGIAGLVLTIGMAVDTNVIIYERIKEELTRGKGYIPAVNEGYKRSLPPVLDAHVTVLLTAIILFYFGLGPVKGFATTQILGVLLSLFCGILVSRWVTDWFTDKKRHLEYFTGVSRRVFKHAKYKFIEYRKVAYGISLVVLALGIGSIFNGFDEGVEFKGGRSYQVRFAQPMPVEKIRDDLKNVFHEAPVIKTLGDNRTLDITTSYLIDDPRPQDQVDAEVETKLFQGLKTYLPPNLSYSQFDAGTNSVGKLGSKKVLPTISDDLKQGAKKATAIALLIITLYIFIRFRDWRYSLGTIVALLHDVLVTLIVFSFARRIVPFPLEIDQHFIAAVLTVIGFSMNDTVIVFDRIREKSRYMKGATKEEIINSAINETLSRTIMTSLTVFLTILILFLVGGEVTKGFAFAMLVGVITGTYSSIFVAAPVLVDLARKKPLGKADTVVEIKPAAKTATPVPAATKS
jgi:SecD/SecF fusion protein